VATDDARVAFRDCHVALLVGARPRGPGMERKDLLLANAQIFSAQGKAAQRGRIASCACLVVAIPPTPTQLIAVTTRSRSRARCFTRYRWITTARSRSCREDRQPRE